MSDSSGSWKTVLVVATVISQLTFWSYLGILVKWLLYLRLQPFSKKTKFQASTLLTIICYTLVLFLQAVFMILETVIAFTGELDIESWILIYPAKLWSQIILSHFILELYPVLILMKSDASISDQLRSLAIYKKVYIAAITFISVASLAFFVILTIEWSSLPANSDVKVFSGSINITLYVIVAFDSLISILFVYLFF